MFRWSQTFLSVSESPLLWECLIESALNTKPTIFVYKYFMLINTYDTHNLRHEWNEETDHFILPKQRDMTSKSFYGSCDLFSKYIYTFRIYWAPQGLFSKRLCEVSSCWHCNSQDAFLKHLLLACPVILFLGGEEVIIHTNFVLELLINFWEYVLLPIWLLL